MSAEIIPLGLSTRLEIPVSEVLDGAQDAGLGQVLVLGRDSRGKVFAAASTADTGVLLLLIEGWKHKLLSDGYVVG